MLRIFPLIVLSCLLSLSAFSQLTEIIPQPVSVTGQTETYELKPMDIVYPDNQLKFKANQLLEELKKLNLGGTTMEGTENKGGVMLKLTPALKLPEGYKLTIHPKGILIEGSDAAGLFYGMQSLLQEIKAAQAKEKKTLPCLQITDMPRYHWRGFMLDESRHFFGKEKVKQLLDLMAYYKLNKFHWHLTDEPAWRIEIKQYPKLTTIGGQGSWSHPNDQNARFYTQEDIKEIVKYAAQRHIEVIPEIDMPGHATAANKAYPEYSGGGTKDHPDFTFNPGKEETYKFLTNILNEVKTLFPSPYVHLGGDEVSFGIKAWETDPSVQALMKKEGMKNVRDAEKYFMNRMEKVIKKQNKILLGWDELLDAKPDPSSTIIMWWRHDRVNKLKDSLDKGYRTVLCPRRPLYFDFIQHASHKWGRTWNGFCPLEDVYTFPDAGLHAWKIPADQQKRLIIGVQANLWTERVQDNKRLDFMVFPRLCALAESAWSQPQVKNYDQFILRMENAYKLFDELGIYYFDHRNPETHAEPQGVHRDNKVIPMDFRD